MTNKDLSLVIPVYNEEDNLAALAAEIRAALDDTGLDYEVLFIDDGSRDGSFACLQALAAADPRRRPAERPGRHPRPVGRAG